MPCTYVPVATAQSALKRLEAALEDGSAVAVIGATGSIAFKGVDLDGLSDLCAYRKLASSNSPALRRALARAEVKAGRKLDQTQVNAGVHSHDGGRTWSTH